MENRQSVTLKRLSRLARIASVSACLVSGALVSPGFGQSLPKAYAPGTARILPVVAQNGMVVSQEAAASQIGLDILKRGGNAVDAAIAVGFALAVTLPRAGNIGGGGFMLVHLAKDHRDIAIDYREIAPLATTKDVFLDEKGEAVPAKSQTSGLGVGVPGTVAGLALASRYGSGNFSLAALIAPAQKLARDGIAVEADLADSLTSSQTFLSRFPSTAAVYFPNGSAPKRGDILKQPDLANTLAAIGEQGPAAFYTGPVAAKIAAAVQSAGGRMAVEDLAAYAALEREPVRGQYRGYDIVSMPPPSSGGIHVIEILNILEGFPLGQMGQGSAATIHLMAEAEKLAFADRSEYLGDPAFVKIPVKGLTSPKYAAELRATISADKARPSADIKPGKPAPYESDQTTHFSVVDADGNAVSNTYTLNFNYGLGLIAEGTGVMLNNELDDFAAKPGAANGYGLTGGDANAPAPNKRPLSSMSPTFVFKNGELVLVTGSPGGSHIITTVVQMIVNVLDFGMNVAAAAEAVRVHHQWLPDQLQVEPGLSLDTIRALEAKGHKVVPQPAGGSAQSIHRADGVLMGEADQRQRGTLAAGY